MTYSQAKCALAAAILLTGIGSGSAASGQAVRPSEQVAPAPSNQSLGQPSYPWTTSPYGDQANAPGATAPGAPTLTPESAAAAATTPAATTAAEALAALEGGSFGSTGQGGTVPFMIGDQGPFAQAVRYPPVPNPLPGPGAGRGFDPRAYGGASANRIVPSVRGFKIADNQSPRPIDRVFVTFNYFGDVNADLNRRFNAPIDHERVYHEVFGFEKTFFDSNASIGMRVPLNTLTIDSRYPGVGGTHTGAGNINVFGKYVLAEDKATGSILSTGLNVVAPTGPSSFAGYPSLAGRQTTQIQPFIGYILNGDRWFWQGFLSVDVPTNSSLATMLYIDNGLGYYLFRDNTPGSFLTAVVPTIEAHVNSPLNNRGYSVFDVAGTPDVVDLTFGTTFTFRQRSLLTVAYIQPVTGPRPFGGEFALLYNLRFGGNRRTAAAALTPPPFAGQ